MLLPIVCQLVYDTYRPRTEIDALSDEEVSEPSRLAKEDSVGDDRGN